MNSLREELGGGRSGVPDFRLMLPPGWTTYDTTERTEKELLAKAKVRLREAHRPDVYAILAGHVERALAAARKQGAFMMIMAGDEAPPWSVVPVSILASVTQGTPDVSLDRMVADAIERRGARALDGSKHFLRWSDERTVELSGESLGAHTVVYLTPIPGTSRRKALQLTATLAHAVDVDPTSDPQMAAWIELLDGVHRDLRVDGRMTGVSFDYDRATAVVVPGAALTGDPAAWAAAAAEELTGHHDFSEDDRHTLARALSRAQQGAVDDLSTNVLLYEPASGTWAPLRLTLLERELTADEQREYLWPPAVIPPQVRLLETQGLGLGCSSTLMTDEARGSVRWLFMPSGVTFFAALAPVPDAAIIPCAIAVEGILTTVRIDGIPSEASEAFDARRLIERTDPDGRAWRI